MSDDLVKKLREIHKFPALANEVCDEAANRIEADAELIQEMREAMRMIAGEIPCPDNLMGNADIARFSLSKAKSQQEGETE